MATLRRFDLVHLQGKKASPEAYLSNLHLLTSGWF